MSWWVYLEDDDGAVEVKRHQEGGTYALGGLDRAELNVTYNYGRVFELGAAAAGVPWEGFREELDGKAARATLVKLRALVERLGTHKFDDYWAPTPGNAGAALDLLRSWAEQHPDAVWRVS